LKQKNYNISIIKHTHHDFEFDKKGKDSHRHKEAGANSVIISNDKRFAMVSDMETPMSPVEIAEKFLPEKTDIVIIEGFKDLKTEKIEVIGDSPEPPLHLSGIENIRAVITDLDFETSLPRFGRDEIDKIIDFIESEFILK